MAWQYNTPDGQYAPGAQYGWVPDGTQATGPGAASLPGGGAPAGGAVAPSTGAAPKVANRGTNGSDPRYSMAGLTMVNGQYVDGAGNRYDSGGRMIHSVDNWASVNQDTPGLPPANQSESYDVYGGTPSGGGGGGAPGSGLSGIGGSSDPYFNQIKSMLMAQSQDQAASTKAQIQKMLIGFGMVPEGFQDKLGALDDLTKSLIQKNNESGIATHARLLEGKRDVMRSLVGRLSSSGLRRSGTKGAKLRKGQLDYDRIMADSLQELLGQVGNAYSGYASSEQQRQMQLLSALQSSNMYSGAGSTQGGGGGGGGGGSPSFAPIWQGTWAEGIDTGGYVPNSGVITDYGSNQPTFNLGGGVVAY
jgi:hypothetical protein